MKDPDSAIYFLIALIAIVLSFTGREFYSGSTEGPPIRNRIAKRLGRLLLLGFAIVVLYLGISHLR